MTKSNTHTIPGTLEADLGVPGSWPSEKWDHPMRPKLYPYPMDVKITYRVVESSVIAYPEIVKVTFEGEPIPEELFDAFEDYLQEMAEDHLDSIPNSYDGRLP